MHLTEINTIIDNTELIKLTQRFKMKNQLTTSILSMNASM